MVHECLPQDAPLAGGKQYDTWATQIYQDLSGAPDSALSAPSFCWSWPALLPLSATLHVHLVVAVTQLVGVRYRNWRDTKSLSP